MPDPRLLLTVIAPDQNQGTPLHVAIQKKHSKLAVLLIQKGAEISLPLFEMTGVTSVLFPLRSACFSRRPLLRLSIDGSEQTLQIPF